MQISVLNAPDLITGFAIAEERKPALSAQEATSCRNVQQPQWKITTLKLGHPVFDGGIRWCMFP